MSRRTSCATRSRYCQNCNSSPTVVQPAISAGRPILTQQGASVCRHRPLVGVMNYNGVAEPYSRRSTASEFFASSLPRTASSHAEDRSVSCPPPVEWIIAQVDAGSKRCAIEAVQVIEVRKEPRELTHRRFVARSIEGKLRERAQLTCLKVTAALVGQVAPAWMSVKARDPLSPSPRQVAGTSIPSMVYRCCCDAGLGRRSPEPWFRTAVARAYGLC
jgi:hypothetical protein